MRGRKPKATQTKRLEGNPGKRTLNTDEPEPPPPTAAFDEPPAELAEDAGAAQEWRRLVPILRAVRQITLADRAALIALCLEWSRYLEATKQVRRLGLMVKTPSTGYPIQNPYLPIVTKALAGCGRLWAELGLTPSARSRVKTSEGPPIGGDAFSEFDDVPTLGDDARPH